MNEQRRLTGIPLAILLGSTMWAVIVGIYLLAR